MGDRAVQVGETVAVKWKNKFYDAIIMIIGLYIFVIVDVDDFIRTLQVLNRKSQMLRMKWKKCLNCFKYVLQYDFIMYIQNIKL